MDPPEETLEGIPVGILIVDDHPGNRTALTSILSSSPYRIVEAGSGPEALRKLLDEEFAVLLVDVVMPEMGGLELAERVRERNATLPVLLMSGYAATEIERRGGVPAGAQFLQKPFGPDALLGAVRGAMEREDGKTR